MLYQFQPKARQASLALTRPTFASPKRVDNLKEQIEAQRAQLEKCIREDDLEVSDLAARARSLLLHLDGMTPNEIAQTTGLSANTVVRVRRRFAMWGASCLAEPARALPTRTARQVSGPE